jgi:hypothetical protein
MVLGRTKVGALARAAALHDDRLLDRLWTLRSGHVLDPEDLVQDVLLDGEHVWLDSLD